MSEKEIKKSFKNNNGVVKLESVDSIYSVSSTINYSDAIEEECIPYETLEEAAEEYNRKCQTCRNLTNNLEDKNFLSGC